MSNILRVQTHSNPLTVKTYFYIVVPESLLPSLQVPPTHTLLLHIYPLSRRPESSEIRVLVI